MFDSECEQRYASPIMQDVNVDSLIPKHNGARATEPQKAFRVTMGNASDKRRFAERFECSIEREPGYFCCNAARDASKNGSPSRGNPGSCGPVGI